MQILGDFGFEPILFFAQIVNFLIIFFLLKKFLYKPMLKVLDERKHKIAEGLKHAEEADQRLQDTIEKEQTILKRAQDEAKKLIEETKNQQATIIQQTEEQTTLRVETMLKEAREQIVFETSQAEKRLTQHVSQLAVEFLQQSVKDLFGPAEQDQIMKQATKRLKEKTID